MHFCTTPHISCNEVDTLLIPVNRSINRGAPPSAYCLSKIHIQTFIFGLFLNNGDKLPKLFICIFLRKDSSCTKLELLISLSIRSSNLFIARRGKGSASEPPALTREARISGVVNYQTQAKFQ
jgi:hypothetical protein